MSSVCLLHSSTSSSNTPPTPLYRISSISFSIILRSISILSTSCFHSKGSHLASMIWSSSGFSKSSYYSSYFCGLKKLIFVSSIFPWMLTPRRNLVAGLMILRSSYVIRSFLSPSVVIAMPLSSWVPCKFGSSYTSPSKSSPASTSSGKIGLWNL